MIFHLFHYIKIEMVDILYCRDVQQEWYWEKNKVIRKFDVFQMIKVLEKSNLEELSKNELINWK